MTTAVLAFTSLGTVGSVAASEPDTPASGALVSDFVAPPIESDTLAGPSVGDATVARYALLPGAGNVVTVEGGQAFIVSVSLGADVTGFDGTLRFDATAVEFGGAVSTNSNATVAESEGATGGVGLSVFNAAGDTSYAEIEARFVPLVAGDITIAFDAFTTVDAAGNAKDSAVTLSMTAQVVADDGSNGPVIAAPAAEAPPTGTDSGAPELDTDITGDGVVDSLDLVEVKVGWDEKIASGDSCNIDTDEMARLDVSGDGCLGVEDFAKVAGDAAPTPVALDASPPSSSGVTFVVTKTTDEGDNQLNDDLCITPTGGCSLRAAIQQANATNGPNRIEFDIPGAGPHTIVLDNKLATINDSTGGLVIDGFTQPGASENTDPIANNATVKIAVTPASYVNDRPAFTISSSDNEIRGLSVYNVFYPFLLVGVASTDNLIAGNFIGTNPAATFSLNHSFTNSAGVQLDAGASHNRIGTPEIADRNLFAGGRSWSMRIEQNETVGNYVQNNTFGLNPAGTNKLSTHSGIDVQFGSRQTLIGGRGLREHNVFAGLVYTGIDFSHNSFNNKAIGNYIGTDLTGKKAFSWTDNKHALLIKDDARLNYVEGNVMVNSDLEAIYNKHNYTGANTFVGNLIGLTLDGTPSGNRHDGVQLRGHDDVFVGNIIANNSRDGINLDNVNDSGANDDELTERDLLSRNSFWANGQQGIDIVPLGLNPNDPGDVDAGVQGLLNHPEFTSVTAGLVTGTVCAGCTAEIYLADASASQEQGRQFLGAVVADGVTGAFSFADARISTDHAITALTIDLVNNTSEFAPRVTPTVDMVPWTDMTGDFVTVDVGGTDVATVLDTGALPTAGADATTSVVNFDVVAPVAGDYVIEAEVHGATTDENNFWVVVDAETGPGRNFDAACCATLQIDAVNDAGVADPAVVGLTAGTHRITFALNEEGAGVATVGIRPLDEVGTAPVLTSPGDLTFARNQPTSTQLVATPSGANFTAIRLPDGLNLDLTTGVVSGTPTRAGQYPVTFFAHNATGFTTVDVVWTVALEQMPPEVTPIADQASDVDTVVSLQVLASDPNNDPLTYSATGLPTGASIDSATGLISGTLSAGGNFSVVVTVTDGISPVDESFTWTVDEGFTCSVTGNTLSWTDQGASQYYIRHIVNGADSYIGASSTLSFQVPSQFGVYRVIYYSGGAQSTECDAPLGTPTPFTCSVTGNTLSWTNQGANAYYIRHLVSGTDSYIGSTNGSTFTYQVPSQFGSYKVIAYPAGRIETQCAAPLGEPTPFTCSVTGNTLSWTGQGASAYYIRHLIDGTNVYVGSTNGSTLTFQVPSQFGAYRVIYYSGGPQTTDCAAPLGTPTPFTCSVAGNTLSWTNQGASVYYVRQQVSGIDQYLGSSSGLSFALPNAFGVFEVRYNGPNGVVSTNCNGTLLPTFTCTVDVGGLITWTDQQAPSYSVRRILDGANTYVATASGLSHQLSDTSGDFRIRYNRNGTQFDTPNCTVV